MPPKNRRANETQTTKAIPLSEYSAKRTFDATSEPTPAMLEAWSGPLLFVIQQRSPA
ncbi:MAG: hypothetical protein ACREV9_12255 [Burkholderiales bacterium]